MAALAITAASFAVTQTAEKRLRRVWKTAVAESMVGIVVRIVLTVLGVACVFVIFGRSWGIPCALGAIPLYFVELVLSVVLLIRRLKGENAGGRSESNQ